MTLASCRPDFALEDHASIAPLAGVDEVGRGPLAGPVVAAAVILDRMTFPDVLRAHLNDSKKVPAARREQLFDIILATAAVGVGEASVEEIDRLNILRATHLAMRRAIEALPIIPAHMLIDGNRAPDFSCPVTCVIKGDQKSFSIAAASVVAKVTRDRIMRRLHADYPQYGWDGNAGYGTAAHLSALEAFGVTDHHRRSFAPVRARAA